MQSKIKNEKSNIPSSLWLTGTVLTLLCLLLRGMRLMALPIFSDEAIYLRWAQLIHAHPWDNAFVSLADPKPPLHFWLMALFWPLNSDPLYSARMLSVITGALSIPALLLLCRSLESLINFPATKISPPTGTAFGPFACILMIFCPFFAFYQRLATADSLFILESILAAYFSLQLALAAKANSVRTRHEQSRAATPPVMVRTTISLGVTLGLAMLTRQNVSYVLWALPLGTFLFSGRPTGDESNATPLRSNATDGTAALEYASPVGRPLNNTAIKSIGKFILCLGAAAILATVIWSPMLLSKYGADLKTRVFYQAEFTRPLSAADRAKLIEQNLINVFVPTYDAKQSSLPLTGWYWVYLTPAMTIGGTAGLFWMLFRRQFRLLGFLGLWIVILLGPLIALGTQVFSRYALSAAVPLLILLAYFLADFAGLIGAWTNAGAGALAGGLALILVIAQGARDIHRQLLDWTHQPVIAHDYYQYINGWTSGQATMDAVDTIKEMAATHSVVVLTGEEWGIPADALWVYLEHQPNIQIYSVDVLTNTPILRPGELPGTYLVKDDKWLFTDSKPVQFADGAMVIYVSSNPFHVPKFDGVDSEKFLASRKEIVPMFTFTNPTEPDGATPAQDSVEIFLLQPPSATTSTAHGVH